MTVVMKKGRGRPTYQRHLDATRWEDLPKDSPARVWRRANLENIMRGLKGIMLAEEFGVPTFYGALYLRLLRGNGEVIDYGLASLRVVTTAGVGFLVDAMQGTVEPEIMRYHGVGTGGTAEASSDAALVTECTTALNPNSTRATGTLTEGASANIWKSVGTNVFDAGAAITEHGIFSTATPATGILLDRSLFGAINVISGDSLESTYEFTIAAGS